MDIFYYYYVIIIYNTEGDNDEAPTEALEACSMKKRCEKGDKQ